MGIYFSHLKPKTVLNVVDPITLMKVEPNLTSSVQVVGKLVVGSWQRQWSF